MRKSKARNRLRRSRRDVGIENPAIMFPDSRPKSRSHGKAGHPAADLQNARRIVARRERQPREARFCVPIPHEATKHFDRQDLETRRRPDSHAEFRRSQRGGERVDLARASARKRDGPAVDAGAQGGEPSRQRSLIGGYRFEFRDTVRRGPRQRSHICFVGAAKIFASAPPLRPAASALARANPATLREAPIPAGHCRPAVRRRRASALRLA